VLQEEEDDDDDAGDAENDGDGDENDADGDENDADGDENDADGDENDSDYDSNGNVFVPSHQEGTDTPHFEGSAGFRYFADGLRYHSSEVVNASRQDKPVALSQSQDKLLVRLKKAKPEVPRLLDLDPHYKTGGDFPPHILPALDALVDQQCAATVKGAIKAYEEKWVSFCGSSRMEILLHLQNILTSVQLEQHVLLYVLQHLKASILAGKETRLAQSTFAMSSKDTWSRK
jgi:hypothetical protein